MDQNLVKVSKFLSLVLRHKPEHIGITLQNNGWVNVDALIKAANNHGFSISKEILSEVVLTNDKQRFSFSDNGKEVRANQGHSVSIEIDFLEEIPPAILFHGTVNSALEGIRTKGIDRMKRQYVHLSSTKAAANTVGARRGKPIVLKVNAKHMLNDGFKFYLSNNGVWLTKTVPYKYLIENSS